MLQDDFATPSPPKNFLRYEFIINARFEASTSRRSGIVVPRTLFALLGFFLTVWLVVKPLVLICMVDFLGEKNTILWLMS